MEPINYAAASEDEIRAEVAYHENYLKDPGAGRDAASRSTYAQDRIREAHEQLRLRGIES